MRARRSTGWRRGDTASNFAGSIHFSRRSGGRLAACRGRPRVAEMPVLGRADGVQFLDLQPIPGEPRLGRALDDRVNLAHAVGSIALGEAFAGGLAVLQEVFLPEGPAAEHAAGPALHGHLNLLLVLREIDAGRQQHPRAFGGLVKLPEVVLQLGVTLAAERAGEFRLVYIAKPAELAGALDHGLGLALHKRLTVFFFAI